VKVSAAVLVNTVVGEVRVDVRQRGAGRRVRLGREPHQALVVEVDGQGADARHLKSGANVMILNCLNRILGSM
jgi:hypothetical protein